MKKPSHGPLACLKERWFQPQRKYQSHGLHACMPIFTCRKAEKTALRLPILQAIWPMKAQAPWPSWKFATSHGGQDHQKIHTRLYLANCATVSFKGQISIKHYGSV